MGDDAHEIARLEACVPAFAPDLEPGLTPAEADLDVLLGVEGGEAQRVLAGALLESGDPVPTATPLTIGGHGVGEVRSCVHSPRLDATIALALLPVELAMPGTALEAGGVRGTVVAKPFYRRRS